MAKIIVIVPSTALVVDRLNILNIFMIFGFLNVAICHESINGLIQYEIVYSLATEVAFYVDIPNGQMIFPDKLKNMRGFIYKIAFYSQPPRILMQNDVITPMIFFLEALGKVQNSRFQLLFLNHYSKLEHYWVNRLMHLTLNTATIFDTPEPKLLTYETIGYCALIPIPPKTSLSQLIFIEPFDGLTWMFLALSIVSSVAVFWVFRGRGAVDSPWLLGYGMFVYFIGQGVDFSRRNRMILKMLILLIIMMIFVLSNAYEGAITSFMIQPMQEIRMKTVNDLIASDYEILTDEVFAFHVQDYDNLDSLKSRMNTSGASKDIRFEEQVKKQHFVLIVTCESAEHELTRVIGTNHPISDYYYLIPERLTSRFVQLEASYMNPFLETFQYYMDLSFQAGLPHMWKIYSQQDILKKVKYAAHDDQKTYLKLEDIYQVLIFVSIGLVLATLALICEISFHDCLRYWNWKSATACCRVNKMKGKNLKCQKVKRLKPKKLKVRRIFVKPRNCE